MFAEPFSSDAAASVEVSFRNLDVVFQHLIDAVFVLREDGNTFSNGDGKGSHRTVEYIECGLEVLSCLHAASLIDSDNGSYAEVDFD